MQGGISRRQSSFGTDALHLFWANPVSPTSVRGGQKPFTVLDWFCAMYVPDTAAVIATTPWHSQRHA